MATRDEIEAQLQAFLSSRQGQTLPQIPQANDLMGVSVSPRIQPSGFNKYGGVKNDIFNPAQEMAKQAAPQVESAVFGKQIVDSLFENADRMIPAADTPRNAEISGAKRWASRTKVGRMFNIPGTEDATSFDSVKEGFGTLLARAFGEKGVVTNRDVSRILKMMPREDDTVKERENKKKFISEIIGKRVKQWNDLNSFMGGDFQQSRQIANQEDFNQ